MFLCGGGVFGHPDGGYAGMRSLFEAWDEYNGKAGGTNLKRARQEFKQGI
jgi:ribulose 1,5-bisphosphate carboxylase large subunit-like protein